MKKSIIIISLLFSIFLISCSTSGGGSSSNSTPDKDSLADTDEISDSDSSQDNLTDSDDISSEDDSIPSGDEDNVKLKAQELEGVWETVIFGEVQTNCPEKIDLGETDDSETSDDDTVNNGAIIPETPFTFISKISESEIKTWNCATHECTLMYNGIIYEFKDNEIKIPDGTKVPVADLGLSEKFKDKKCIVNAIFNNTGTLFKNKKEGKTKTEITFSLEGDDCASIINENSDIKALDKCTSKNETTIVRVLEISAPVKTDAIDALEVQGIWKKEEPVTEKSEDAGCKTMESILKIIFPSNNEGEEEGEPKPYWFALRINDALDKIEKDSLATFVCDDENCNLMSSFLFWEEFTPKMVIIPKGTEVQMAQLEDNNKQKIDCYLFASYDEDYAITFTGETTAEESMKITYHLKEVKDLDQNVDECDQAPILIKPIDGCWTKVTTISKKQN